MNYRSEAEKRMLEALNRTSRHYELSVLRETERLLHKLTNLHEIQAVNLRILDTMTPRTRAMAAFDEVNRCALETVAKSFTKSHFDLSKQLAEEIRVLTDRAFHRGISTQIAALAHSMRTPDEVETSRFLNEVVASFNFLIVNLSDHSRENIRNSLAGFQYNAAWAALDTIRTLASPDVDSLFSTFLEEVFDKTYMLHENDLQNDSSPLPDRLERFQLSHDQVNVWLIVVSLLFALYSAIQTGQPVKVDPYQLAKIVKRKSLPLGLHSKAEDTYVVERASVLKTRPRTRSQILGSLVPHDTVRLMYRHHKWAFVQYFDRSTDSVAYGWTYKKYLRRPINVQISEPLRNRPIESTKALTREEQLAISEHWEQTNQRRVELINKEVDDIINESEKRELEKLQHLADERIRRVAPLPLKELEMTLQELKREI